MKAHWMSVFVCAGVTYLASVAAADRPVPDAAYLQLSFVKSPDECRAAQKDWQVRQDFAYKHKDLAALGFESGCFKNGLETDPIHIADYVFQVVSRKEELIQPANTTDTFTFKALAPAKLAKDQAGASPQTVGDGPVKYYEMMNFSKPISDAQEREFNDWYDNQHVPDVLRNPGFTSAQRFRLIDDKLGEARHLPPYLVMFTFQSGSLDATDKEFTARIKDGRTRMSRVFSASKGGGTLFVTPID